MPHKPRRNILLNPGPVTTTESVKRALVVPDICPREKDFGKVMREVGEGLVRVVHGEKSHVSVLFAGSGTAAVEACIAAAAGSRSRILIIDNGAYGKRMAHIASGYYSKADVRVHSLPHLQRPDPQTIDRLLKSDPRIRHLAVVHHETTTGMLNPVEDLLAVCRKRRVGILVDAMSSFAGIPIDVRRHDYDFVVSSANKCLEGMPGIAFVVVKRSALRSIAPGSCRTHYLDLRAQHDHFEATGQMRFTPPVQTFYALRQALREFEAETQARRYARYTESWRTLLAGLERLRLKTLLPEAFHSRILTAVVEPSHPAYSFEGMHDFLYQKGVTVYPGKTGAANTFRVANIGAIDAKDITLFLHLLRTHLRSKKILP